MFKCLKCNKEFKYDSEYNRHKNRKISCNESKKEYKCEICKIEFVRPSHQKAHDKTKKHIKNINIFNQENINGDKINNLKIEYEKKINDLENENKKLKNKLYDLNISYENKINLLKDNCKEDKCNLEYIYILHERTFIQTNNNIYKIGRTTNINTRLNGYTKGSKLLFTLPCKNSTNLETKILNYLKNNNKYYQCKEYGTEYFKCILDNLIDDIIKLSKV